jgi:hypothetical protein
MCCTVIHRESFFDSPQLLSVMLDTGGDLLAFPPGVDGESVVVRVQPLSIGEKSPLHSMTPPSNRGLIFSRLQEDSYGQNAHADSPDH